MTGHTSLARAPGTGKGRMLLLALLALTGLALFVLVIGSLIRFAMPPAYTEIGLVENFPPSAQPYVINADGKLFFVVNTGGELFAHYQYPLHQRSSICRLKWITDGDYFTEGCYGTKFNLDGSYITGPPATMPRYPLVVEDGKVFVDLTRTLPGPELEDGDF
jgi:nitrite reductase/ring-hydroxylating ferredoxin subunit